MKKAVIKLFENLYGWIAFLTMALGVLTATMFGISFIIGGGTGESIAVIAGTLMSWGIRFAAIAMLIGLVYTYMTKQHSLTLGSESKSSVAQKEIDAEMKKVM
ncbi:hypothetical protein [Halobacillus mangrovi]|uniref:Uncharacterized protein n=1 Tax=Halobacillus mangrovi TaxID=402384 RepID=A0A1W5ZST0_9BACI|nr:hypothetical protein [Halobacillus mangrovi]ARI76354.1 hypothetical protein HM131_05665 [Halobacillus mangrovi]